MRIWSIIIAVVVTLAAAGTAGYFFLANSTSAELDERWASFSESSTLTVDHDEWQLILDDYLVTDTESEVNLFDYEGLLDDGRDALDEYVLKLENTDPLALDKFEQKAYWINLYNVLTVQLILDNYPVLSITKLGSNKLEFGPWNEIATKINNIDLSLNDIEHRIIRPLYNDYRIHFAVNCASIGCPNLAAEAFTADSLDEQLDAAAAEYLNHPRGIRLDGEQLVLSSLFDWYADDFGSDLKGILKTLGKHTTADLTETLTQFSGKPEYFYDWSLNGYCFEDDACGGS